ncbi:uncharacterized protein LOC134970322 [Pseudophryne corroboree]|uniref:uncharacterized protein LOC134970322 n=1 Tax=Pseudophryne corroboree TaxID=495146 RepID=UPI0030821C86
MEKVTSKPDRPTKGKTASVVYFSCSQCGSKLAKGSSDAGTLCASCSGASVTDQQGGSADQPTPPWVKNMVDAISDLRQSRETESARTQVEPLWAQNMGKCLTDLTQSLNKFVNAASSSTATKRSQPLPAIAFPGEEADTLASPLEEGEVDPEWDEVSAWEDEEPSTSSGVRLLIEAIRQTLNIQDTVVEETPSPFFKRQKRQVTAFPSYSHFADILKEPWLKPDSRFQAPKKLRFLYPFTEEDTKFWETAPKVDAPISHLAKATVIPSVQSVTLKDATDRKIEALLKSMFSLSGVSLRPVLASAWVLKAVDEWLAQVVSGMQSDDPSEAIHVAEQISEALTYVGEALLDSVALQTRVSALTVSARRSLWLRVWNADSDSKQTLTAVPFEDSQEGALSEEEDIRLFADRPVSLPTNLRHDVSGPLEGSMKVGARLLQFRDVWLLSKPDRWVMGVISRGYMLDFEETVPTRLFITPLPDDPSRRQALLQAITNLLQNGVIIPVPSHQRGRGFYSGLFLVDKPDGSFRPILNLKALNPYLSTQKFKMESIRSIIAAMEPGEYLASIDIKDAYLHVPIWIGHQSLLRFAIGPEHFQFQALPFGLSTAPRVFTKVLGHVVAVLRCQRVNITPYLDDLLVKAPSAEILTQNLQLTMETLQSFGWIINFPKSSLLPSQKMIFLGLLFDTNSQKVFLPADKIQDLQSRIRTLLHLPVVSVLRCMQVLGKMVSSFEAVPYARFHARPLQTQILNCWTRTEPRLELQLIRLSIKTRQSLHWWLHSHNLKKGAPFTIWSWMMVTTDASLSGWGAVFQTHHFQGRWSNQESKLQINILELRAIRYALIRIQTMVQGQPVRVQSDNATAVAYINKQGGTRSWSTMREVAQILAWAERWVPVISAIHIPGVENWEADFLSRHTIHPGEWELHPEVFLSLVDRWGMPDIDLMASRLNAKLPHYGARTQDPQAILIDALTAPWQFQLGYVFPPIPLIPRLLQRIRREGLAVILVTPDWPRRQWYTLLRSMVVGDPFRLPLRPDLLLQGPCRHPDLHRMALTAWLLNPRF